MTGGLGPERSLSSRRCVDQAGRRSLFRIVDDPIRSRPTPRPNRPERNKGQYG
ncbi:hypothetical protein Memar_1116 [Methanoculleus marisnigri JR1]|uniref:Uncharacterized protein n=1 Tax=Methanoculleus marisnigri (strain ATCC 35101 / DSM 1498 / JR1) TaxID=368407 RepID=A3CUJ8_METMJ|nr:hypothetical protein Memar_1116 [Methanoculleus marisnigri JR1]